MREPILKELDKKDINYCFAAWEEFTTLTHEEKINLKSILYSLHKQKDFVEELLPTGRKCKVFCKELNKFFNSKTECANFFKTQKMNVSYAIKQNTKLLKKYTIEEV